MSAPPYQQNTPAPGAQNNPDPIRHLNAPPYPLPDQLRGRPARQFNAADQDTQQPTVSQNDAYETEGPVLFGGNHRSSNYPNQLHSTYDSSSSGYHAQGQVSNSLNIDPALLAMGQGANEDAQMFDASFSDNDTSLSKYEPAPAMPAPGLDSLHSKPDHSHDLMLPPPLPLKDLAHNTGNNDYIIFTQLNGVHSAASPDVFSPKFMNSGDGYTVGGASAMEESREYSSSNVSPTRKRASSSSDDSSSNVSIGNAGERFHNLQHPMSSSKRARITKPSPSFSSSESQVSISMSRRESLLAADYSGVKVASRPRKGMSPKEAAERCFKRVRLSISGDDNVDEVKAEREMWLDSIMQAFDAPYNQTPKTKNIDLQGFQHWQKEHHALTMEQFEEDPADDLAEAIATHLYNQVVDGHEKGSLVESCGKSFRYDTKLNCKDRLEKIIKALTGLTIIRFDIVTGARVNELVANPDAVFKRKEENKLENDRKRVRTEAAKAADKKKASALTAKNGKAQVNDKRGGQTKSAAVEDDHESSSGSDDASGSEKLRSSTRISTSVPEPRPVEPFNDDESSSRPDHEKLASAPEALASSARGVSTSISVSNPVKQVYSDESSSGSDW